MTFESMLGSSLIVVIYRFTISCIDQCDGLCLQSLQDDTFVCMFVCVFNDVWSVCTI